MTQSMPSLYERLLQNVAGETRLQRLHEEDQLIVSILDNVQRILNSRAGTLAHLPDYGLPDMSEILQALPGSAHQLMDSIAHTLRVYEPRLRGLDIALLPQKQPGHLEYALELHLHTGAQAAFATTVGPQGNVRVWRLKPQT
ncbi:type VI secretion system baseplate subunit TssE [Pseudomonas putida]